MDNTFLPDYSEENKQLQNTSSKQFSKITQAFLDYHYLINDSSLFDSGYRLNSKDMLNDFSFTSRDDHSDVWIEGTALNNKFHYRQYIHAFYFNYQANIGWIDLQAGLRTEYTQNDILDYKKDHYLALFPSVLLSKKLSKALSVYISGNRRINRLTIKMLNPNTNEYADVFNTYKYCLDLVGTDEIGFEYSQRNRRKNESQYFIFSFSLNIENKEKQKKNPNYFLEGFGK
jgi:hypothetical protein